MKNKKSFLKNRIKYFYIELGRYGIEGIEDYDDDEVPENNQDLENPEDKGDFS